MTHDMNALRQQILDIVSRPNYKPQKPKKFLEQLGLGSDDKKLLKTLILELIADGKLAYGASHLVFPPTPTSQGDAERVAALPSQPREFGKPYVVGRFQRKPSGIGFVRPRRFGDEELHDIFIPAHLTRDAASGDTVAVEIFSEYERERNDYGKSTRRGKGKKFQREEESDRGPRGRVVEIIERASNRFVGTFFIDGGFAYVKVDGSLFKEPLHVGDAASTSAQPDDKVVVEMINFPTPHNDGEAVIVEVLGPHGVPGLDTLLILREYNLPENFGDATLRAARDEVHEFFRTLPDDADSACPKDRYDATAETTITIDPVDARDFDDAVSLTKLENGNWLLGVHIADVTHFVRPGSPIDKEAMDRATSVYLPDRVIPMLPEVLSNSLASLQPGKLRFTKSVYMEFTKEGVRTHTDIYKSAIRSDCRTNYDEVQAFLNNRLDNRKNPPKHWTPPVVKLVGDMHELAMILRQKRFQRGSLEMNMPEVKVDLDNDGSVVGAHVYPYGESNQIIEEFMLAANEAVAAFLHAKDVPFIRRVHMPPSLRKLRSFADFVRSLEIADLDADEMLESRFVIQKLLDHVKGTQNELAVNFSLLRSMQKAIYSPDTEGHYALASGCYTHFTSPIRRYPDLSVHRLLDKILGGETPKPELRELVLLGEHCSEREQRAEEAERQLVKLKLIDYMSKHIGDKMEAVITGVEMFGVFVMGVEIPAEGLIRLEALTDDIYRFDRNLKILTGNREGSTLRIGDRLIVEVVRADIDSRQIDFRMVKRLKTDKKTASMKRSPVKRLDPKAKPKKKKNR